MTTPRVLIVVSLLAGLAAADEGQFARVASYVGQGALVASAVAPGPRPGSERFFASFLYVNDTFEVASIDPDSGDFELLRNPIDGEYGARCMTVGPDGNVYLGTLPGAHFVKLDTKLRRLVDLGRPSRTESFVWDIAFGSDGRLYGVTQPNAKLVRYDPRSGAVEDLGRMDAEEEIGRYVATSADGFVYVGIGTRRMNVVAYAIATGEHRPILPERFRAIGIAGVFRGADGRVYAVAGAQRFRLDREEATPVAATPGRAYPNRLRDGRTVALEHRSLNIVDPKTREVVSHPFAYRGRGLPIFRLGLGPDGYLYASSILPARLLRIGEQAEIEDLGELGDGEVYQFLAHRGKLLMGAYACAAPLMAYDPSKPFSASQWQNPTLQHFTGDDPTWRPQAFVNGPDGKAYVGAVAGYGKLGGPLCAWNVEASSVDAHTQIITDQSVSALAVWRQLIVGGTTIAGGSGTKPTQKSAKVFLWDPQNRKMIFSIEPVANAQSVDNLVVAPGGLVYGLAGHQLFVFDIERRAVTLVKDLPFPGASLPNTIGVGPDVRIWGLAAHVDASGVFAIDPRTHDVELVARAPQRITAGFAIKEGALWFASGPSIYRFAFPVP